MKAAGVIVEYNPFHNGHFYHIKQTKNNTNADVVVAIMSGNFLQRGEPALVSKWTRAKMALAGGADIIVELPYSFATQNATTFAYGSVYLLDALRVDSVCFGSENGEIEQFYQSIQLLEKNKDIYDSNIREALKKGYSYPKSASIAFQSIMESGNTLDLSLPNNILGFQYIQAIKKIKSNIKAATIKRTGANYHDETFQSPIASATSIRKTLEENYAELNKIHEVVPEKTYMELSNYVNKWGIIHSWEKYFPLLKYRLLTMMENELRNIYEVEEGLENRIFSYIQQAGSFNEFIEMIKTKRYTWTKLQRMCVHILTNTTKESMKHNMDHPHYIRLLGMSKNGQMYLNRVKKQATLPILSRVSSSKDGQLQLDIKAVNAYSAILQEPLKSEMIRNEYSTPPIIV